MNDTKSAFTSSGVWGSVIAGLSSVLLMFHVRVVGLDDPTLPVAIAGTIGAVIGLFGRIKATAVINHWI
jgi:hypothetical protein